MERFPTIVSLVSEQTAPTILFIIEYIRRNPNKYNLIFLSTDRMKKEKTTINIERAINISCDNFIANVRTVIISHDDIKKIGSALENKIIQEGKYIVNVTGGTKIMSIAVYEFFTNSNSMFRSMTKIFYLTLGKNSYTQIYPENMTANIQTRLSVKEYLYSYGIGFSTDSSCLADWEQNRDFAIKIFRQHKELISGLVELQNKNYVRSQFKKNRDLDLNSSKVKEKLDECNVSLPDLKNILTSIGFSTERISRRQLRYITGGWFEEYTFEKIKREQNILEESIAMNVKVWYGISRGEGPENEFDVIFINDRNGLSIIECKSSISDEKKILTNTLYKMAALKNEFGLHVKSLLYTMSSIDRESDLRRAESLGIVIRDRNDLVR